MLKHQIKSIALVGLLSLSIVPFSASAAEKANPAPFQVQLRSGGIPVPGADEPVDGITSGINGGLGECVPNIHTFYKDYPGEHIVFTVRVDPPKGDKQKVNDRKVPSSVNVVAEVYSGSRLMASTPVNILHEGEHADWLTGDTFLTGCLFLKDKSNNDVLPTGDYTYKFKAIAHYDTNKANPVSDVVSEWVPNNHSITIKSLP